MTMDEFQLYHEQTFDSFSKRVIKNIAIDILREEARLAKRETSLSALSAQDAARLSAEDTYELDEEVSMSLDLHGYPIQVHDPILGPALLAPAAQAPGCGAAVLLRRPERAADRQAPPPQHISGEPSPQKGAVRPAGAVGAGIWSVTDGSPMRPYGPPSGATRRRSRRSFATMSGISSAFAARTVYDEEGVPHKVIDENRRKQIEAEYVAALILRYDADRRPGEAPEGA